MDELALLPPHIGVDENRLDRAILTDEPGLVVMQFFASVQPLQEVHTDLRVGRELGDVVPEIIVVGIAEQA